VDFFAGNEAQIIWSKMPCSGHLPEMFRSENAIRTIAGYNTQETFGRGNMVDRFSLLLALLLPQWSTLALMSNNWDATLGQSFRAEMVM
jgi:hypothetical protein